MIRRLIFAAALTAALLLALLAGTAAAQRDLEQVEITTTQLADGIYMLQGAGGNIGLCVGPDGAFLIDSQFAPLTDKILAAVRAIDERPLRLLLNTHWHGDHVGGNANLHAAGAMILAHENVRARLATDQMSGFSGQTIPARPREALPVLTFSDSLALHWNGREVHVIHIPLAHTDGDAVVWFPEANVLHTGDLLFNGFYPYIDFAVGGSADGMIAAADRILAMVDERTKIIPGHGPLADKAALRAFRDMLAGVRDAVAREIASGKSREEVLAAKPTAAYDAEWGDGSLKPDTFAGFVYDGMARR